MGWYMVKSGLENKFDGPSDVPRVSQYRLATHLSLAFVLYTLFLWSALDQLLPAERMTKVTKAATRFRMLAHSCKGLVFLTAISGSLSLTKIIYKNCIVKDLQLKKEFFFHIILTRA